MKRFNSIALAAVAVVMVAVSAMPAAPVDAASSAALSIVPKKNYVIEPGKSVNDTLTIRNLDNNEPLELSMRVVDFTFHDDGGTPKLMLAEDAPQTTWSLKPFLKVPKSVTIAPNASKTLDMSVAIPKGHGAGSYYSAIVYSSGGSEEGNVGLSASGVTLVFTQIPGKVKEDLKLERLGAYYLAVPGGREAKYVKFATEKPEAIAYTLKNNGNVTEAPVGSITLKHMLGQEKVINDINPNSSLALIGQTRTFTSCIKLESEEVDFQGRASQTSACTTPSLWPGRYSIELNAFYGQNGNRTQEIVATSSFWYLPWWFIAVVIILIVILTFVVWRTVNAVRGRLYGSKIKKSSRRRR